MPSAAFVPDRNVDYYNLGGKGGAYIVTGTGSMVAPVYLPHGAKITMFKVYFVDNSPSNMVVSLNYLSLATGQSRVITKVDSYGVVDYGSRVKTIDHTVNNALGAYSIKAYSSWDGIDLKIIGVLMKYELNEAP